jgi:hypothetical protein
MFFRTRILRLRSSEIFLHIETRPTFPLGLPNDLRQTIERAKMASSVMLRRVALVRTEVSEELSAFAIRVTRIGELGTTLAVTSNRPTKRKQRASVASYS